LAIIYKNAPITEAVFDIRISTKTKFNPNKFEAFQNKLSKTYSEKQTQYLYQGAIKLQEKQEILMQSSPQGIIGYLFKSPEQKKVVQVTIDGFTFNKLKPYESWTKFINEAKTIYSKYSKLFHDIKVERIALRYINNISIPDNAKTKQYLKSLNGSPKQIPNTVSENFSRLVGYNSQYKANTIVSQKLTNFPDTNASSFILDIDVYKFPQNQNLKKLFSEFGNLRDLKNLIFEEYLTPKLKETFK